MLRAPRKLLVLHSHIFVETTICAHGSGPERHSPYYGNLCFRNVDFTYMKSIGGSVYAAGSAYPWVYRFALLQAQPSSKASSIVCSEACLRMNMLPGAFDRVSRIPGRNIPPRVVSIFVVTTMHGLTVLSVQWLIGPEDSQPIAPVFPIKFLPLLFRFMQPGGDSGGRRPDLARQHEVAKLGGKEVGKPG